MCSVSPLGFVPFVAPTDGQGLAKTVGTSGVGSPGPECWSGCVTSCRNESLLGFVACSTPTGEHGLVRAVAARGAGSPGLEGWSDCITSCRNECAAGKPGKRQSGITCTMAVLPCRCGEASRDERTDEACVNGALPTTTSVLPPKAPVAKFAPAGCCAQGEVASCVGLSLATWTGTADREDCSDGRVANSGTGIEA